MKQKTGKWRIKDGAQKYVIIRSCINTYKKNGINVLEALISSFNNKTIIALKVRTSYLFSGALTDCNNIWLQFSQGFLIYKESTILDDNQ